MKRLLSKLLIHLLRKVDVAVLNENCSEYDIIESTTTHSFRESKYISMKIGRHFND